MSRANPCRPIYPEGPRDPSIPKAYPFQGLIHAEGQSLPSAYQCGGPSAAWGPYILRVHRGLSIPEVHPCRLPIHTEGPSILEASGSP